MTILELENLKTFSKKKKQNASQGQKTGVRLLSINNIFFYINNIIYLHLFPLVACYNVNIMPVYLNLNNYNNNIDNKSEACLHAIANFAKIDKMQFIAQFVSKLTRNDCNFPLTEISVE